MKNSILYLIGGIFLLTSCQRSLESKADGLIEESIKKSLYHPESYEPVETKLDSAFAPYDSPEFYEKTLEGAKLSAEITEAEKEMKTAKSSMSIWVSGDAFSRNEYKEAKEKYDAANKVKIQATEKMEKLAKKIKEDKLKKPVFIGYKAYHKFRANNNAGNTTFGEFTFIFDKEMSSILASYDMDSEEYTSVQYLYKIMKDAE